jgi:hypothetical protein
MVTELQNSIINADIAAAPKVPPIPVELLQDFRVMKISPGPNFENFFRK